MHLLIPRVHGEIVRQTRLSVTETRDGIRLSLDTDDDGIGVKHVDLSLPEACDLASMLSRIRRRVASRPGYRT